MVRFDLPGEAFAELALDLTEIRQLPTPHELRVRCTQQRRVPAAVLVIDHDHSLRLREIHEELQPAPARPRELRQELEPSQQLRSTRHGDEPVLTHPEPMAQEFVEVPLVTRIAAVDHDNAGLRLDTVR